MSTSSVLSYYLVSCLAWLMFHLFAAFGIDGLGFQGKHRKGDLKRLRRTLSEASFLDRIFLISRLEHSRTNLGVVWLHWLYNAIGFLLMPVGSLVLMILYFLSGETFYLDWIINVVLYMGAGVLVLSVFQFIYDPDVRNRYRF